MMTSFAAYLYTHWQNIRRQTLSLTVSRLTARRLTARRLTAWRLTQRLTARQRWVLPILAGTVFLWSAIAHPAQAYQVQVLPTNPVQGDTLSVVVQGDDGDLETPTVTVDGTTYTAFPLSSDRTSTSNLHRALVPTSPNTVPGRMTLRIEGPEGTNNIAVSIGDRSFNTQYITLSSSRAGLEGTDHEFDRLDALRALQTPERYWNGPMSKPSNGYVSSAYGNQRYYNGVFAEGYYHRGVDYAAGNGSPVYAPAAGRIALVGRESEGFVLNGNTLGIDHGQGVTSVMIHLSGFAVNEGDFVEQGQLVGYIGSTGFATGPNLHWGLFVNEVAVDPVPWRQDGIE